MTDAPYDEGLAISLAGLVERVAADATATSRRRPVDYRRRDAAMLRALARDVAARLGIGQE